MLFVASIGTVNSISGLIGSFLFAVQLYKIIMAQYNCRMSLESVLFIQHLFGTTVTHYLLYADEVLSRILYKNM